MCEWYDTKSSGTAAAAECRQFKYLAVGLRGRIRVKTDGYHTTNSAYFIGID